MITDDQIREYNEMIRAAKVTPLRSAPVTTQLASIVHKALGQEPHTTSAHAAVNDLEYRANQLDSAREQIIDLTKRLSRSYLNQIPDNGDGAERVALDAIDAWQDLSQGNEVRHVEVRKQKRLYAVILSERSSCVSVDGERSVLYLTKPFRLPTRLAALEAAAAWCRDQE